MNDGNGTTQHRQEIRLENERHQEVATDTPMLWVFFRKVNITLMLMVITPKWISNEPGLSTKQRQYDLRRRKSHSAAIIPEQIPQ
ncbi:hypothetical protein CEXT_546441 [Caerostris extrusa]|uniref:Uncharacterized protein n=1 Tax=Caerostris extrusa TaxID=172846 RepID=A0AAV4N0U1_CAEEX|nr:hypothetical protein CEXT_546441 [Caerostris extrusa]